MLSESLWDRQILSYNISFRELDEERPEYKEMDAIALNVVAKILKEVREAIQDRQLLKSEELEGIIDSVSKNNIKNYMLSLSKSERRRQEMLFTRVLGEEYLGDRWRQYGEGGSAIIIMLADAVKEAIVPALRSLKRPQQGKPGIG